MSNFGRPQFGRWYSTSEICGCYYVVFDTRRRQYLPQTELKSHTRLTPVCFTTRLQQKFSNTNDTAIPELRYVFPLYDGVAVGGYTIRYGDKQLTGIVKQKDVARKTYQAAVDRGETASLLESLPAGIFGVTLGNVPARTDIYVTIDYLGDLKHDAGIDGLRYTLPTAIAPRYGSYPTPISYMPTVATDGIKITIDIDMGKSAIRKIQSPSHPIAVTMGNLSSETTSNAFNPSKGTAELTQGVAELGDDFILQLLIDDISKPQALIEKHTTLDSRAIMATLVPKFNLPLARPEIVFIADQSGSMGGSKNTELKAALHVFLKSLPFGVCFNICAFGNSYTYLFAKSQPYNESNLKQATDFVDSFRASYGGTEILEPMKQAFLRRLGDLPLEVMLLTDGEIWREENLFNMINEKIHTEKIDARVFTLGIGSDVSHTLVDGVARAGNGFAQFIIKNEETDKKIVRMLRASLFPHTKDYSLSINFDDREEVEDDFEIIEKSTSEFTLIDKPRAQPTNQATTSLYDESADMDTDMQSEDRYAHLPDIKTPKILQAPSLIPPLFPFNRTTLFFLLGSDAPRKAVKSVTLECTASSGPLKLIIPISEIEPGTMIHQMAARKAVQELEDGRGWIQEGTTVQGQSIKHAYASRIPDLVEREAVRLGEQFQVANKWCSFVATDGTSEQHDSDDDDAYTPIPESSHTRSRLASRAAVRKSASSAIPPPPAFAMAPAPMMQSQQIGTSSAGGLFGSTNSTGGGLFGNSNSTGSSNKSSFSLFGGIPTLPGMSFGANRKNSTSNTGFGAAKPAAVNSQPASVSPLSPFTSAASYTPVETFDSRSSGNRGGGSFGGAGFGRGGMASKPSVAKKRRANTSSVFSASTPLPDEDDDEDEDEDTGLAFTTQSTTTSLFGNASFSAQSSTVDSKKLSSADRLRLIINAQKFAGSWQWTDELRKLLDLDDKELSSISHDERSVTALVLAYLESKMAAERDVWELVASKAQDWLDTQCDAETMKTLRESALAMLQ